jgi:hypothetical protein
VKIQESVWYILYVLESKGAVELAHVQHPLFLGGRSGMRKLYDVVWGGAWDEINLSTC